MRKTVCITFFFLILLNSQTVYGAGDISFKIEMLPWKQVNYILPKYTKFTVIDVESGRKFRVQRRAGSQHADVQPLSAQDTKIMKKIYGGKWSWKRRSIIVAYKDQWLAASMHGMPHGAGALQNNFPGHFCIHFFGSKTHRSDSMDLAHMLMILKAAGKLDVYLGKANPYEVINAYIVGLKQQDNKISSRASLQKLHWKRIFNQIDNVKISRMPLLPAEDLTEQISLDVPIEIDWFLKTRGRQTFNGEIHLVRFSPYEGWKIDSIHFLKENNIKIGKNKTPL
ncbi:hypothetical protein [Neobacillus sp. PS3-40]|uniref:hypothetical protein n=1 Tax=Neobacillus sp. PS3-40 TaxID=3070679 RepID=UPI0027E026CA|nr:hypothetical protein [Neobacillus sp. PS3-40]WML44988.1 hypothetical protein RCG20_03530 [Neobacillus sp. PS3-40]